MLGGCNKKRFAITPPELLHGVKFFYILRDDIMPEADLMPKADPLDAFGGNHLADSRKSQ